MELLIVVVILGILGTVTVFAITGTVNEADDQACAAERKTLEQAADIYLARHGVTTIPETAGPGGGMENKFEWTLVNDGLLVKPSKYHRLNQSGGVVAKPTERCA